MANPPAGLLTFANELVNLTYEGAGLSRRFPLAEDIDFYLTLYPDLRPLVEETRSNCLNLARYLLQAGLPSNASVPNLNYNDPEEIIDRYSDIIYATDERLEFVDNYFDEKANINKRQTSVVNKRLVNTGTKSLQLYGGTIQRPQLEFERIDNSKAPFIPKLSSKPNAKISLEEVLQKSRTQQAQDPTTIYPNPYEYEIDHYEYLPSQLQKRPEQIFKPLETCPLSWIETPAQLQLVADKLDKVSEFAVDLEHHAYRTYQGFCCLIQISTRDEDFVIDALALRNYLEKLNSSFTNPKIVKVLHGADNDILWLQRDFGLYVVNMFDTGQASRQLDLKRFSLAFLLEQFCGVASPHKKELQVADWRIRPLPEVMLDYARSDTHYLLYIYDRLQNFLIESGNDRNNLLIATLDKSRELCKLTYHKGLFQPSLQDVLKKTIVSFNQQQLNVLTSLYEWRDETARDEDESVRYVLPNHMLLRIAELIPQNPIQLFSCCNPQPTPLIKANASQIIRLILEAIKPEDQKTIPPASNPVPKPISIDTPVVNTALLNVAPASALLASPEISQDQLFKQADWFTGQKRYADFQASPMSTVTAGFFSATNAIPVDKKIAQIHEDLASSLSSSCFSVNVPDSMEEIYKLSNANRKRNKEKKKLKEDSINAGPVSPIKFADESPVQPGAKPTNTKEFMKKIGWPAVDEQEFDGEDNDGQSTAVEEVIAKPTEPEEPVSLLESPRKTGKKHRNVPTAHRGNFKTVPGATKPVSSAPAYDYSKHNASDYGLKKADDGPQRKRDRDQVSVNVPSFGKVIARANRGGTKSHTTRTTGQTQKGGRK